MASQLTVHDPRGYPPKVTGKRLAPRPESLDGKTVYLVDCLFDNSAEFMDQLQRWFAEDLPRLRPRLSGRARARSRIPECARRSRRTATPQFSASAFEAPAARRSSGSR